MTKIIALLAVGFAGGCGGGVCNKAEQAARVCKDNNETFEQSKTSCEESLKGCSDADKALFESVFDCIIDTRCARDKFVECMTKSAGISKECASSGAEQVSRSSRATYTFAEAVGAQSSATWTLASCDPAWPQSRPPAR